MKKIIRILIFAIVIQAVSGFGTVGLSNDTFFKYGERYIKIKSYTDPDFITALKLKYTGHSEVIEWIDEITNPELLNKLDKLPTAAYTNLENDITSASANALKEAFNSEPKLVEAWKKFDDAGLTALRADINQLQKFDNIVKSNNLNLDADGLGNILKAKTTTNSLPWEHPENILDAVKRASDANIDNISVKIKAFPTPADGSTSYVLNNAKQYQFEASGDTFLSFEKGTVSFDNIDASGKLIDRKWGHSTSIFNEVDDGFGGTIIEIHNNSRVQSILEQAQRQVNAANGKPIKWEISTDLGARGIRYVFDTRTNVQAIKNIEVVYVPQITIIP